MAQTLSDTAVKGYAADVIYTVVETINRPDVEDFFKREGVTVTHADIEAVLDRIAWADLDVTHVEDDD